MDEVTDDLCDRAFMGEDDVCHSGHILVKQRSEDFRFGAFHQRGETGDVSEDGRDLSR